MNMDPQPAGPGANTPPHGQSGATGAPPTIPPAMAAAAARFAAPRTPMTGRFLVAVLVLAAFAATTLPQQAAGLALAVVAAGLVALIADSAPDRDRFTITCFVAAALLALTPAIRAAWWVQAMALVDAFFLSAIAASRSATWREVGAALWRWVPEFFKSPVLLVLDLTRTSAGQRWERFGPVLRGAMLALPLVAIFGALFASGDAAFANATRFLVEWHIEAESIKLGALFGAMVVVIAVALWQLAHSRSERPAREATHALGSTEWAIALGSLVALFAMFIALQLATLFGGDDHVLRTAGLTYAEYARQGVAQLAVAAALTLLVIAAAARYGPASDRVVRGLIAALSVLTLVLLGSAVHRLGLYEDAYGATRTRFIAHLWLWWLGAVFVAVLAAGATGRTKLLPRAVVLLSAATALWLVIANPDGRIANRNIDRAASGHTLDVWYLESLSVDAVPSLHGLTAQQLACIATSFQRDTAANKDFVSLNLGRDRAEKRIAALRRTGAGQRCSNVVYP